jgi:hypothetical protein
MDEQAQGGADRAEQRESAARPPYERPTLKVYGAIATLTKTIGNASKVRDGGSGNKSKTG